MNQEVMEKAKELAAAIQMSQEDISMRVTEDAAMNNPDMTAVFARYQEKRSEVEALTMQKEPDFDQLGKLTKELQSIQDEFNAFPMAIAMQNSRKAFSDMMADVNAELSRVLAPDSNSGCSGNCSACGGCH